VGEFKRGALLSLGPIATYSGAILFGGQHSALTSFQDDASYYFVIAENLLRSGRSTFDGITTTNGYHPLWFLLNVVFVGLSGLQRQTYVTALVILCGSLAVVHAALLRYLMSLLVRSSLIADLIVLFVVLRCLKLSFCGMECAIAMPLVAGCAVLTLRLCLLRQSTPAQMAALGLLVALTALARLDAIMFGLGCAGLVLCVRPYDGRALVSRSAVFVVGLSPFLAYLSWNWVSQGAFITTSAQSKMLAPGLGWNPHLFEQLSLAAHITFLYVPVAALALLAGPWTPWRGPSRQIALLIFAFPICYYVTFAIRSSWLIWVWYLYPLPLCLAVGLAVIAGAVAGRGRVPWFDRLPKGWLVACAVPVVAAGAFRLASEPRPNKGVFNAALKIADFSVKHPGQYAMGDRAGLTALLVDRHFLQLEGLVADSGLLTLIREQRRLSEVLAIYHVDYLVETSLTTKLQSGRCQEFVEPKELQSGWRSPKLHGSFCDPLLRYDDPQDGHTTLVYSVHAEADSGSSPRTL
jgi:hypothetical protein